MGSKFKRGEKWYLSIKGADGRWQQHATGTGDEREADRLLADVEARMEAQRDAGSAGPITVRTFARSWIQRRREVFEKDGKQYRDWATDDGRLRNHILPRIGDMKLASVRPRHLADFVHQLRTRSDLAPHTIRNVYGLVAALFRDAAVAGHIDASPCILTRTELGEDGYVDEQAQQECRYAREQLELLITSPKIEEHARVFVAIGGLAGLRLGEIAGLRISDLDVTAEPLWRLRVATTYDGRPTKTGRSRVVPVHPVLASMLAAWIREGWARTFGRAPNPDDPIVPRAPRKWARPGSAGAPHTEKTGGALMDRCLDAVGIAKPAKKTHALRSTFISLAIEDDADDYLLEKVTHTTKSKSGRAFDVYAKPNWAKLCSDVAKLAIEPGDLLKSSCSGPQESGATQEKWWRRRESKSPGTSTKPSACCTIKSLASWWIRPDPA